MATKSAAPVVKSAAPVVADTASESLFTLKSALVGIMTLEEKSREFEAASLVATYGITLSCAEMIAKRWAYEIQTTPANVWNDVWKITLKTLAFDGFAIYRGDECETLAVRIRRSQSAETRTKLANEMFELSAKDVAPSLAKIRKVGRLAFEALATNCASEIRTMAKLEGDKLEKAWRGLFLSRWGKPNAKGKAELNFARLETAVSGDKPKKTTTPGDFAKKVNENVAKLSDVAALETMKRAIEARLAELAGVKARVAVLTGGKAEREAGNATLAKAVAKAEKPAKVAKPKAPRVSKTEKAVAAKIDTDSAALADAIAA